jgi:hypothetical protein
MGQKSKYAYSLLSSALVLDLRLRSSPLDLDLRLRTSPLVLDMCFGELFVIDNIVYFIYYYIKYDY